MARDVGAAKDTRKTSLRRTIDELAANLKRAGTRVVSCFNYTGTPYVGQEVLPEVVYAFGLQTAIDKGYLKKVKIHGYTNPRSAEFVRLVIDDFLSHHADAQRHERLLPKMAFFAATIEELKNELRPAVEEALARHNIPAGKILVNVGDSKLTSNDDIREFNRLDTYDSDKQFILLVNKGREGWNCRSLFAVALFRKPKSKIFVLQATMRCLRAIGTPQQTGHVYLSHENRQILENELQQNFRVTIEEIESTGSERDKVQVRVVPPPVKITLNRVRKLFSIQAKKLTSGINLQLAEVDTNKYRLIHSIQEGLPIGKAGRIEEEDITHRRTRRQFSRLTLVAEVARYLNKSCLEIETILESTEEGIEGILESINEFNELLYDIVIPRLFKALYETSSYEKNESYEVELVKIPKKGYYEVSATKELTVEQGDVGGPLASKSFHLDTYCFDSKPERQLFWDLLRDRQVKKLYFTGMLTHGQSDFYIQYIDPNSHTIRSYYPDFLFQKEDGTYVIVEVKGDNRYDDPVVQAKKEFAEQMAHASGMTYQMIKGSQANASKYSFLLTS